MSRKKAAVILILATIVSVSLHAATIQSIRISGDLSKTREQTVLDIIGFSEGDSIQASDEELIRQRILKSGIFVNESIVTELIIRDEQAELLLELEDRMSLIPIPMFMYRDGKFMGGLFLMDMNFLGTGDKFYAGGIGSADSQFVMANYRNIRLQGGPFDLEFKMNFSNNKVSLSDIQEKEIENFDVMAFQGGIAGYWNYEPFVVMGGFETAYLDYDFQDKGIIAYKPRVNIQYDERFYEQFMSRGLYGSLDYESAIPNRTLEPAHTFTAAGGWEILAGERIQFALGATGLLYDGDLYQAPNLDSRLLSNQLRGEQFMELNLDATFVLADFSWAYLALPVSYNYGYVDGFGNNQESFHGPGAGLSLYLKKMAMPAVSIQYARDMVNGNNQFSASIGMGK